MEPTEHRPARPDGPCTAPPDARPPRGRHPLPCVISRAPTAAHAAIPRWVGTVMAFARKSLPAPDMSAVPARSIRPAGKRSRGDALVEDPNLGATFCWRPTVLTEHRPNSPTSARTARPISPRGRCGTCARHANCACCRKRTSPSGRSTATWWSSRRSPPWPPTNCSTSPGSSRASTRTGPDTWYEEREFRTDLDRELHIYGFVEAYHHQLMWDSRQTQRVYDAFVDVWDCEELWVTLDRLNLNPPNVKNRDRALIAPTERGFDIRLHWDIDSTLDVLPAAGPGHHRAQRHQAGPGRIPVLARAVPPVRRVEGGPAGRPGPDPPERRPGASSPSSGPTSRPATC